jgi:hypothetical protein
MPRFDGTGPQGGGPLTGRGDGYCAVRTPQEGQPYGVAGLQQRPFGGFFGRRFARWFPRLGGRGRGAGRGRGRWRA